MSRRGWLLIFIGALLAFGIAAIGVLILLNLDNFNGGPELLALTYFVLCFLVTFGVVSMVGGTHMVLQRRRHRRLKPVMYWLMVALVAIGLLVRGVASLGR